MKWITWRVLLKDSAIMYPAVSRVRVQFIDKVKSEGKIIRWYTSLKNNDGRPSFRVYLEVKEQDETYVHDEFEAFMKQNRTELGWTGQFFNKKPGPSTSEGLLQATNKACELLLRLEKRFPERDIVRGTADYLRELRVEMNDALKSIRSDYDKLAHYDMVHLAFSAHQFLHFVANNQAQGEDWLYKELNLWEEV